MPNLLTAVAVSGDSGTVVATGPVLVTVTGAMKGGTATILADIGGGFAKAYSYNEGDPTSLARLELSTGTSFKANFKKVGDGAACTVSYLYIV